MNRCNDLAVTQPSQHSRLAAALLLSAAMVLLGSLAQAQSDADGKPLVRNFPPSALRGEMQIQAPPVIAMDGKPDRLSPGARIRDTNNMLVMSASLINRPVVVNYVREPGGLVHEVWILNSEEARQRRPNMQKSLLERIFGSSNPPGTPPN